MILEYTTLNGNGTGNNIYWWMAQGEGVRMMHANAECYNNNGYFSWKYSSGENEYTNYNAGKRFIRLVGEGTDSTDNLKRAGDSFDTSISDFRWYDDSGQLALNPGFTVTVDSLEDGAYKVTVHPAA